MGASQIKQARRQHELLVQQYNALVHQHNALRKHMDSVQNKMDEAYSQKEKLIWTDIVTQHTKRFVKNVEKFLSVNVLDNRDDKMEWMAIMLKDCKAVHLLVRELSHFMPKDVNWQTMRCMQITCAVCLRVVDLYEACHTAFERKIRGNVYLESMWHAVESYISAIYHLMSEAQWSKNAFMGQLHVLEGAVKQQVEKWGEADEEITIHSGIAMDSFLCSEVENFVDMVLKVHGKEQLSASVYESGDIVIRRDSPSSKQKRNDPERRKHGNVRFQSCNVCGLPLPRLA